MKKKEITLNISFTVIANLLKLITSFILTIVVPRYLGVTQYGYWQLFLLYTTYMGYSYLGIADGMYLKDGGKDYKDIDINSYSNRIKVLTIYEAILACVITVISYFVIDDSLKLYLILWASIDMVIYIPRQTMKLILQATNRIKEYSISISIFTVTNCALICGMLLLNIRDVKYIVVIHAFTEFLSFLYTAIMCKDIWRSSPLSLKDGIKECVDDAKIGLNVLIASAASTVSIGIIRNAIEVKWGIEEFGSVSLALSISKLFLVFINSVAVVLFPILRRINSDRRVKLYTQMRSVFIIPFWVIMLFYYPAKVIIGYILPQYVDALNYVTYLIPMCLFECIMALLVNTYLKTERKEKMLLIINVATVLISIVATSISVEVIQSIIAALIAIVIVIMIRTIAGEICVAKYLNIHIGKALITDVLMSVGFIAVYLLYDGLLAIVIYCLILLVYCVINKSEIFELIDSLKVLLRKE